MLARKRPKSLAAKSTLATTGSVSKGRIQVAFGRKSSISCPRNGTDGKAWYAELDGHYKLAKIGVPSGRSLADAFGDDMDDWKGRTVHVTPTKYNTGWGYVMDPIEDDAEVEDAIDDDDIDIDEEESID